MSNLNFISPFFIVSNLKDSVDFYVDKLGFEVWYTACSPKVIHIGL